MSILRKVQAENRPATAEEQRVLARWGGWGAQGLWQVLDDQRTDHIEDRARLRGLLTDEEWAAAKLTTINAHYTDAALVEAMWSAVTELGFDRGRVLEPGCGSGTFIGMAPPTATVTGVELDSTTAAIASLLYPQASILNESFADTRFPAGYFDLVVGNVPFAKVVLHDPRYNSQKLSMHNHFIVKSLELTRPGGLVAVLTSRYTMDSANPAARRAIAARADMVAAVRLPSKAHWRAAGTEAVTDLLILRRRADGVPPVDPSGWLTTSAVSLEGPHGPETTRINEYWQTNPRQVLGSMRIDVGMHGTGEVVVDASCALDQVGGQLTQQLQADVARARRDNLVWLPRTEEQTSARAGWVPAARDRVDGELISKPHGFFQVEEGGEVPVSVPKTQRSEVHALLEMRDLTRSLIEAEASTLDDDPDLDRSRERLAQAWKSYVGRYGPINRYTVRRTGRTDKDTGEPILSKVTPAAVRLVVNSTFGTMVAALEVFDDMSQTAEPATIMKHRVIVPRQPIQGVETAADGLAVVLDAVGKVDLGRIAELRGTTREEVISELGDRIFETPATVGEWQTRAHYLSGDVRTKLDVARQAEAEDPGRWAANVQALELVLPPDLGPADIAVRLGAPWIPDTDHEAFLREILNTQHGVKVVRITGSTWDVEGPKWGVESTREWGTERMPAPRLAAALIGQRKIAVYDRIDERDVLNEPETEAAQEKGRLLQERFAGWLWEDPERTGRLITAYNRAFNSVVMRDYTEEGRWLTLPGLAKSFTPHEHQRTAVARMINEPSVGLFHVVGAGKTAEMAIGATELRRLGLVRKPAVVVPNNMLEQFSREWLQLYPQAKVLAASAEDLTAENRRRLVARIATNDWDAVVMTRTAFQRLSLSPKAESAYRERKLAEVRDRVEKVRATRGDTAGFKRVQKAILAAEERLAALRTGPVDSGLHFEHTGIDYLVIDELHHYKNLRTDSSIQDAQITPGSGHATDLEAKLDYLRAANGARVITGATATPIANSITEMHVLQRYMDPDALAAAGIDDFDTWAATFGEVVTGPELTVAGGGRFKMKSRFARFVNLPELLSMFGRFADVKTAEDLNLPRPQIAVRPSDGQRAPRVVIVPPTAELKAYIAELDRRSDQISRGQVEQSEDNMLKVSGDGRKAGLAMRLVHPSSTDTGKVETAADELFHVWNETKENRYLDRNTGQMSPIPGALQLVFCDLSTPNPGHWSVYQALKEALIARGMPPAGIRFIHEARTDSEKAKMFAAARSGHISVLIGSTTKLGVGTNVQNRAIHLLDIDAPWRPADVEQRHGRILRQGNQNPEVRITQLITEGSFDAYMWQTLERKARFIDQVLSRRLNQRDSSDIGDAALNAAEVKALASGNPLLLSHAAAAQDLHRLTSLERTHTNTHRGLRDTITWSEKDLAKTRERVAHLSDLETRTRPTAGEQFAFHLARENRTSTDRAEVATLLNRAVWNLQRHERLTVGSLGGHEVEVAADLSYDRSGRSITHFNWRLKADDGVSITTTFTPNTDRNRVEMGTVIRLEHMVSSIPAAIGRCHTRIGELEHTITQSERLVDRPFQHTQALIDARAHYADLSKRMAEIQEQQPEIDAATAGFETVAVGTSSGAQMQRAAPATTGPAVRLGPSI